ncbi:sialate O-acetylesterase [Pedobacter sp. R-06]|uniref:sialate O-acetylesterase n=1 Tax=Pedobacter sp. R-06 TaxID=3404051 RepID=UPI003CE9D1F8
MKIVFKLSVLFMLLHLSVSAKLRLPALVADHMVLQRDIKIPVWGWAEKGEEVQVTFKGATYKTTADDNGKWTAVMQPTAAGGPYELTVKGKSEEIRIKDIMIGDVWICSGQSNMVFDFNNARAKVLYAKDIAASENNQIRQILVTRVTGAVPNENFKTSGWRSAKPEILNGFSVAAYFFARELYEKNKVAIGLINASWGGTKAEAWTSEEGIKAFPQFENEVKLLKDTAQIAAKIKQRQQSITDWHLKNKTEDKGYKDGSADWASQEFNDGSWKTVTIPTMFEKFGFANTFGVIWFRKEIDVPEDLIGKDAVLKLGNVDDEDETFINGTKIGGYANREKSREHTVASKLIKAGKNIIAVRVINWNGPGGFAGNKPMVLDFGTKQVSIDGNWKYELGRKTGQLPGPYNPQDLSVSIYNGMIAPLIPYAIKGVIWYQGENNGSRGIEYRTLFPAMIADWRLKWKQGDFPFIFQQLVNYRQPVQQPAESDWAELREAQLMTLSRSANTAMAVGIDIGEAGDIHPVDKLDVGKRLALAARKLAYGEKNLVASGPVYKSMRIKDNKAILSFTSTGAGLKTKDGKAPGYFALAGADKKFYWADAVIVGNQIEVSSKDVNAPVAVRYAWADNPEGCNLINNEGLPASPFRTDDWERVK